MLRLSVKFRSIAYLNRRCFCAKKSEPNNDKKEQNNATHTTSSSSSGSSNAKGPITWASFGLMTLVGAGIITYYQFKKEEKTMKVMGEVTTTGKPALGGPFVLVNHKGEAVTDATYRGQYVLLYFGFTYCPDICPNELVKVGKVVDKALKDCNLRVKPIFISVDPARDTVGQINHYRKDFHPDFEFLTGTPDQIAAVTRAYRVYFSKVDDEDEDSGDYLVDHSIVVYLLSPEGDFLDFFTQRMQVGDIVDRIRKQVAIAASSSNNNPTKK